MPCRRPVSYRVHLPGSPAPLPQPIARSDVHRPRGNGARGQIPRAPPVRIRSESTGNHVLVLGPLRLCRADEAWQVYLSRLLYRSVVIGRQFAIEDLARLGIAPDVVAIAYRAGTVAVLSRRILRQNPQHGVAAAGPAKRRSAPSCVAVRSLEPLTGWPPRNKANGRYPGTVKGPKGLFQAGGLARAAGAAMGSDAKAIAAARRVRTFVQTLRWCYGARRSERERPAPGE